MTNILSVLAATCADLKEEKKWKWLKLVKCPCLLSVYTSSLTCCLQMEGISSPLEDLLRVFLLPRFFCYSTYLYSYNDFNCRCFSSLFETQYLPF